MCNLLLLQAPVNFSQQLDNPYLLRVSLFNILIIPDLTQPFFPQLFNHHLKIVQIDIWKKNL